MQAKHIATLALLTTAFIIPRASAREQQTVSCDPARIIRDVSVPPSVGHLGEFVFTKREGFFEVNALFTNANVRPVEAVFANLELFDQAGQRLMTVPANMTIRSGESHEQWPTKLSGIQEFVAKSPLPSGARGLLVGYSPRSIGTCPASAILSYFEVFYADGTTFKMHSPAWYFDAIPYRVPNNDVATFRDSLFQGWVEATVDSDGRVHVPSSGELSSKDMSYLQEMVKSWVFLPAVYSGAPTETAILMFVSRGSCTGTTASPPHTRKSSWISVNICPRKDLPVEEVYIGGFIQ